MKISSAVKTKSQIEPVRVNSYIWYIPNRANTVMARGYAQSFSLNRVTTRKALMIP